MAVEASTYGAQASIEKGSRLDYLDGLRGVAALSVVLLHFLSAYVFWVVPEETPHPLWIADTPLAILYNGRFCVIIFFVLSGFVVSKAAAKSRDPLALNLFLRYLRLALPATASVVFAWVLLKLLPNELTRLDMLMPHRWIEGPCQGAEIPGLGSALRSGLVGTFRDGYSKFNGSLWTMRPEFLGSCALYVLYFFARRPGLRFGLLMAAVLVLPLVQQPILEGFVCGALLQELWSAGRLKPRYPALCLLGGVLLGFEGMGFSARMHLPQMPLFFQLGEYQSVWDMMGATLIVYSCLTSSRLQHWLSTRLARFLGKVSFALYLFHAPLLYTVITAIYLKLGSPTPAKLCGLFVVFVVISFCVAYAGTVGVDLKVLQLNSRLRKFYRGRIAKSQPIVMAGGN